MESDKPIRKPQIKIFKDAGYFVPDSFFKLGIFHVQLGTLIVTASYGSNRFNIRCTGAKCEEQLLAFEAVLDKAINS